MEDRKGKGRSKPWPPARGTTSCAYYSKKCDEIKKQDRWRNKKKYSYYCIGAPAVCKVTPDTRWDNCVRLCLQEDDDCFQKSDSDFTSCTVILHGNCFTRCEVACTGGLFP